MRTPCDRIFAIALLVFEDMTLDQNRRLPFNSQTGIYQTPAGWWFSDNLCKTLSKGQAF
jgi:hypothetical protein